MKKLFVLFALCVWGLTSHADEPGNYEPFTLEVSFGKVFNNYDVIRVSRTWWRGEPGQPDTTIITPGSSSSIELTPSQGYASWLYVRNTAGKNIDSLELTVDQNTTFTIDSISVSGKIHYRVTGFKQNEIDLPVIGPVNKTSMLLLVLAAVALISFAFFWSWKRIKSPLP
jgi:hypothetical protein